MTAELVSLEDLCLTMKDVETIVKKYFSERGGKFQVVDTQISRLEAMSKSLLATHYILTVDLKEKKVRYADMHGSSDTDSCEEAVCSFFVKALKQTEYGIKQSEDLETFHKECRVYHQLIPRLHDVGIGHKPWAAHCYFHDEDRAVVLENLCDQGYILSSFRELDVDHMKIAMKTLARMHASSLALEIRTRANIPELYPGLLDENGFPESDGYRRRGIKTMTRTVVELCKLIEGYDEWDKNEAIEAFPMVINRIYKLVKPSDRLQNVFNQSDCWANNILFKFDEEIQQVEGTEVSAVKRIPVDARLVDFQFSRYAPPVYDITILMYSAMDKQSRTNHKQEILEAYYSALEAEADDYGFVIGDYIPKVGFMKSYEEYKLAGLIENLLFNGITFLPLDFWNQSVVLTQEFEKFYTQTHTQICLDAFKNQPKYRERMLEILREIIDDYVLKPEWNQRL